MGLPVTGKPHLSKAKLLEWRMHRAEQFMAHLKERIERLEEPRAPLNPAAPQAPMATAPGDNLFDFLTAPAAVASHNQGDD